MIYRRLGLVFLCIQIIQQLIPQELLVKILDNCRERNIYLVLDECFIEFCRGKKYDAGKTGVFKERGSSEVRRCVYLEYVKKQNPASSFKSSQ